MAGSLPCELKCTAPSVLLPRRPAAPPSFRTNTRTSTLPHSRACTHTRTPHCQVRNEVYEKALPLFDLAARVAPHEAKWSLMAASCARRIGDYGQAVARCVGVWGMRCILNACTGACVGAE